jgi:phosphoglycolate phosphatase-like HAD superfamily hydrolase
MTPHTFLFDMDGTLLDSTAAVVDAVATGLTRAYAHHHLPPVEPDIALISRCMGLATHAYFEQAFPADSVPENLRSEFALSYGRFTAEEEVAAIDRGETRLYDGVAESLTALKSRGHTLLLFSNAGEIYFDAIIQGHDFKRWFTRTLCVERARREELAMDKNAMVRVMIDDPGNAIVIGDRIHDIDAGRLAGARTIGCLYGFGEASEFVTADWTVDSPAGWLNITP